MVVDRLYSNHIKILDHLLSIIYLSLDFTRPPEAYHYVTCASVVSIKSLLRPAAGGHSKKFIGLRGLRHLRDFSFLKLRALPNVGIGNSPYITESIQMMSMVSKSTMAACPSAA